ncbi:two component, sigma54 specific, transcriptional regulator, Fis family [Anaeromyxobacter dehalogenans 2CP-1]|uniref:Two component, sigma54 specific, transcriptional regulator, Fis family n=1 Tax=Anaeromyxobacter dehalogenans (strain ATCC BAA-258 / DSM 21875 / 2CP-1) TaxID=455488 RepID=B8J707_ANAD2|nr:sigma-54 dependent transcriptional regulator [Anaeromyxobacter dehalogenans]ACL65197.1 two component, sigma54 specific, transcriptional regulator, Fis family [Anaeromyxobacter dehalogenans 2CP-1]
MSESFYPAFAILAVDDEAAWLRSVSLTLERAAGITHLLTCQDARRVMEVLDGNDVGVVLLDLTMPHLSGEDLLGRISVEHPDVKVIVVSGMNQVETAVRCMKLGAFDYHVKTEEEDRLVAGVLRAVRMQELQRENGEMTARFMSGELRNPEAFAGIVTQDRTMLTLFSYVEAVARSPQPLLVTGESGVGKELVAGAAHRLSGLPGKLVAVNVAGLDDAVFADTLFGHVRGAFTGAEQPRRGMVEEAADGTLFLDEIGDLSVPSQVKLLRFLQEGEFFPLGSDRPKRVKVRVVAATHQDLAAKERAGMFRRDLYYRLRTHRVRVPPLRERREDVPLLLDHFLGEAARQLGKKKPTPPKQLAQLLMTHDFPGNVRELRAMCFDAVSRHRDRVLSMDAFLEAIGRHGNGAHPAAEEGQNPFGVVERLPTFDEALELLVQEAMRRSGGNQTLAARLVGISQPALSKRLKSYRR